jgi:hypothetical protein
MGGSDEEEDAEASEGGGRGCEMRHTHTGKTMARCACVDGLPLYRQQ